MKTISQSYDLVVCGGGLAGFCAAVAAARHGVSVCLIQDRPVFGGNSSSEIRVTPHGAAAFHAYARETGIISELLIAERAVNHEKIIENGWTNSVWDMVMYDMAVTTPNLTFHLNTSIQGVTTAEGGITAVRAVVANAETVLNIEGKMFIDCTGDGIVADQAGCEWRFGTESKEEFDEPHAPIQASSDTMGNSIHFRAKDMGSPVPFRAPDWAVKHEDPDYFYKQGRNFTNTESGYWWIEIGIPWDTIHDNENIRHELTRHTLGIWDWMKNRDPVLKEKTRNMALDWIGQVPGKRESRRVIGEYFMTEHDILNVTAFEDEIAFGGWFIDLHTPGGLLADHAEPSSAEGHSETSDYAQKSYCGPYGIPFRIMVAKDANNLMMAGRNVSVTHAALGTVRVMSTTALMGQAAGTGAAYALRHGLRLNELKGKAMADIRQQLLRDGCFLPNAVNIDEKDHARQATVTASSVLRVSGSEPSSRDSTLGFRSAEAQDALRDKQEPLSFTRGQWIALEGGVIDSIEVCLSNLTGENRQVRASIVPVDHIWDYRVDTGQVYGETVLVVPPGEKQWIRWEAALHVAQASSRFVRLQLDRSPDVQWHSAGKVIPGHIAAYDMGGGKMRRYSDGGTLSYRLSPPQRSFGAEQIITGVTRPYRGTNLWISDPAEPLPQQVNLNWEETIPLSEVQLTFPGHLFREYHQYPPFYWDPQCPKDYRIEALIDGEWTVIVRKKDNFQQLNRHKLDSEIRTASLCVIVEATNGDPSAALYEIRCYG